MEKILYRKDRILLFAAYGDPQPHKHFSKHILVSDQPFVCLVEGQESLVRSMVISSQTVHSVQKGDSSAMVVFLIDETSNLSRQIEETCLQGRKGIPLGADLEEAVISLLHRGCALEEMDACVMGAFHKEAPDPPSLDERVREALHSIEERELLDQELYRLLPEEACLSKSRFLHLFKEEMGIDLKNYLLLKRLEKVYRCVTVNRMSITEAALLCGFSSSSHFSQACKQHYGISLTDFLKAQTG